MPTRSAVILFDGICNLCTWTVQFIVPRDPTGYFRFASLQSPIGQQLLAQYGTSAEMAAGTLDSIVLLQDGQMYFKSDAALRIARQLSGIWASAYVLRFIPRALRDWVYAWIAAHRYQIFGQRETCLINLPNSTERFLESPFPAPVK